MAYSAVFLDTPLDPTKRNRTRTHRDTETKWQCCCCCCHFVLFFLLFLLSIVYMYVTLWLPSCYYCLVWGVPVKLDSTTYTIYLQPNLRYRPWPYKYECIDRCGAQSVVNLRVISIHLVQFLHSYPRYMNVWMECRTWKIEPSLKFRRPNPRPL